MVYDQENAWYLTNLASMPQKEDKEKHCCLVKENLLSFLASPLHK